MPHENPDDFSGLQYNAAPHFRLIEMTPPDEVARLEAEMGITQGQAVTDIIERTTWGDHMPQYRGGKGTPRERRDALLEAKHEAFADPIFDYPGDPNPCLNAQADWDAFEDDVLKICKIIQPVIDETTARIKAELGSRPSLIIQALFISILNACFDADRGNDYSRRPFDMFKKLSEGTLEIDSLPGKLSGLPSAD